MSDHTPDIRDEDRLTFDTLDRALRETFGYSAGYRSALLKDWLAEVKAQALEEAAHALDVLRIDFAANRQDYALSSDAPSQVIALASVTVRALEPVLIAEHRSAKQAVINAAMPTLERQFREQIAYEIEDRIPTLSDAPIGSWQDGIEAAVAIAIHTGMTTAAEIARRKEQA